MLTKFYTRDGLPVFIAVEHVVAVIENDEVSSHSTILTVCGLLYHVTERAERVVLRLERIASEDQEARLTRL